MAGKGERKTAASSGKQRTPPKGTPFPPGKSGNPTGLPAWRRDLTAALKDDALHAAKLLRGVVDNEDEDMGHRIQAAGIILRYTVPPPKQSLELSGAVQGVGALDEETLRRIAAAV